MRMFLGRLGGLWHRRRDDERLSEEIETHLEFLAADWRRRGLTPAAARLAARREFGGVALVSEIHRGQRGVAWLDALARDLRYAFRQLRAYPGFAAAAVLTLALGIGANTAIFRVLDAVALRSLPVPHPEQLVLVETYRGDRPNAFNYPLFREVAARQHAVAGLIAMGDLPLESVEMAGGQAVPAARGRLVSGGYFATLGAAPRLGRALVDADETADAPAVCVISDAFWRRVFGGRPEALGQTLRINRAPVAIVGVAPPGFFGDSIGAAPDFWVPLAQAPRVGAGLTISPAAKMIAAMARLRPDVPAARAASALSALCGQLSQLAGESGVSSISRVELAPGGQGLDGLRTRFSRPLWMLMAIVSLVLLIACCNLANLLMARATARTHEIGVRLALGAGRGGLVRQLLTESLVLGVLGTALGLALAAWGARALIALAAAGGDWRIAIGFGWRVLAFTAAVCVAAVCLFGLAPALAASRLDVRAALQDSRGAAGSSRRGIRFGRVLAAIQIAVSLLLVAGASLLGRSFWNLLHQDLGYRPDGVLLVSLPLNTSSLALSNNPGQVRALTDRLQSLPGVQSVALDSMGPLSAWQYTGKVSLPGRPYRDEEAVRMATVSPSYFKTLAVPILAGRPLTPADSGVTQQRAVLSETAARRLFGGASPIGREISLAEHFDSRNTAEVVGVARDARTANPRDGAGFLVYLPWSRGPITVIEIRAAGDVNLLSQPVRLALAQASPGLRTATVEPLWSALRGNLAQDRLMALLSGAFGALALLLASVGLYGAMAYGVARRTREIGIRVALGATRARISGLVMRDVGWVLLWGLAAGGAATLILARWLQAMLFGLAPRDPAMLSAAAAVLSLVAGAAGYLPARRAARSDPMQALRRG